MEFQPLTVKQRATIRLAEDPACRLAVYEGAVSSGKTITSALAWSRFVEQAPDGVEMMMIGKTLTTLIRNVLVPLTSLLGERNVKVSYGTGTATIFGRRVMLLGADASPAVEKVQGRSLYGAYCDELLLLGGPARREFFEMLRTRMRVPGARIYATLNPGGPTDWLLTEYLQNAAVHVDGDGVVHRNPGAPAGVGLYRFTFRLEDNTTLDPAYVESLRSSYSGVFADRFIRGLWVAAEGSIYPVDKATHVIQWRPAASTRWVLGIDHGVTNDTSAVLVAVDTVNRRLVVAGECRVPGGEGLTVRQQVDRITSWITSGADGVLPEHMRHPDRLTVVVDPAAAAFRNEWTAAGWVGTQPANNAVLEGIADVTNLLGSGRLVFTEGVPGTALWRELSGYRWAPGKDAPIKKDDHGPDALRYAVRGCRATWKPWTQVVHPEAPVDRIFQSVHQHEW